MRHSLLALSVPAVIALAACGGSDGTTAPDAVEVGTTATDSAADSATDAATEAGDALDDGVSDEGGAAAAGGDPTGRPAPDTCVTLPESPDGVYAVADAGTVELTVDGDALVLGESVAADGWEVEETSEERDEVDVEFRRDGEELDFEADLEDGTLQVQVCADDD